MKTKSFTLIELLVVIVIIGILAGVIIVSTSSSINKANFAKAQAFSNTVQQELLLNLVSEWTFDEGDARDTWGNNDGTVYGAIYVPKSDNRCVYGGCYSFDGIDDYIVTVNKLGLFGDVETTINFWAYWSGDVWVSNHVSAVSNSCYSDNSGISTTFHNGRMALDFWNKRYRATQVLSVKKWHFLAFIKSPGIISTTTQLYIDGNRVSGAMEGTDTVPTLVDATVVIGRLNATTDRWWKGMIDDVRIYNIALPTSQIKQEYIAGLNSLLVNNSISKEEYDQRLKELASNK